eukprot:12410066-Karenia_brevis.AAC.1
MIAKAIHSPFKIYPKSTNMFLKSGLEAGLGANCARAGVQQALQVRNQGVPRPPPPLQVGSLSEAMLIA